MPRLLLLAHPDDEFAIFPLVSAPGDGLHVAWLTERRRRESTEVLERLGVPRSNLHFLGHEWSVADGSLYHRLDDVVPRLLSYFGWLAHGSELMVPAWEGGHPDHDACHLAGIALARHLGSQPQQFSLYQGEGLPGPLFKVLTPLTGSGPARAIPTTAGERMRYVWTCLSYRSQWKSFVGLLPFYAWRMRRSDAFVVQPVAPERTAQRPHIGALLYERRGGPSWDEFAHATARYRFPHRA
jgi:N-acetylglucosamine malate deacetylase 1